jgi:hypothetical protein
MTKEYEIHVPGLAEVVASVTPDASHKQLVKALQRMPGLEGIKLATTRGEDGGSSLSTRGVYAPDGTRLHDDHEVWFQQQVEADGGSVRATYARLQGKGYTLSTIFVTTLYLVVDHGGDESNFTQIEVWREHELMDRELLNCWDVPRDLNQMVRNPDGPELPAERRVPTRPARYRLRRVSNIARFLQMLEALETQRRDTVRQRQWVARDFDGEEELLTTAQLDPDFDRYPHRARRLFNDWAASSAGRSGARLCDHWIMTLLDWTNPKTRERSMDLTPQWTFGKRLAEVQARKGDVYSFFGKLQTLDRRVQVPFAWYFYMLHGNRVSSEAAERVLEAAEAGLIVLDECDYRVLKDWQRRPYGF